MLALHSTSLALIITEGVGDQPIRATGLLIVHLDTIANQLSKRPRIWILRPAQVAAHRPWDYLNRIANSRKVAVDVLVDEERRRLGLPRSAFSSEI